MQVLRPEARRLERKWGSVSRRIDGGTIYNKIMVVGCDSWAGFKQSWQPFSKRVSRLKLSRIMRKRIWGRVTSHSNFRGAPGRANYSASHSISATAEQYTTPHTDFCPSRKPYIACYIMTVHNLASFVLYLPQLTNQKHAVPGKT